MKIIAVKREQTCKASLLALRLRKACVVRTFGVWHRSTLCACVRASGRVVCLGTKRSILAATRTDEVHMRRHTLTASNRKLSFPECDEATREPAKIFRFEIISKNSPTKELFDHRHQYFRNTFHGERTRASHGRFRFLLCARILQTNSLHPRTCIYGERAS